VTVNFNPAAIARPGVLRIHPYQPGRPVEEIERDYGVTNALKLASNENPLGPSPKSLLALAGSADFSRYPDGNGFRLKESIARRHGVDPAQITLGNGSNDVLELAARAFAGPGDQVLYSQYSFAVYALAALAAGAEGVEVPAQNHAQDLDETLGRITPAARLVFIANPNNPTCTWHTADALRGFLDRAPQHALIVVDEAYAEYMNGAAGYPDCAAAAWLARYPNLVVTRTFSKIFGLAGLRVGYALSSAAIADLLNRIRQPFNVSTPAQAAACAALGDGDFVARSCTVNAAGTAALCAGLAELGITPLPPAGNFVTFATEFTADRLFEAMLHQGVIIRSLASYKMPRHVRITVGGTDDTARCLIALRAALSALAAEDGGG